jgi:hypothetical protein
MTEEAGASIAILITDAEAAEALGHHEDAYALFQKAYCLYPDPILRHGLSSTALKLNRCDEALSNAVFWELHGDPSTRPEAVRWLKNVEEQCPEVKVLSDPAGADIVLDKGATLVAVTPWSGHLRTGTHAMSVSHEGFAQEQRTVTIPPGPLEAPIELVFTLRQAPVTRAATGSVADLPLDFAAAAGPARPPVRKTPPVPIAAPPAPARSHVVLEGGDVPDANTPPITVRLPPPPVRLVVEAPKKPRPPSPAWVAPVAWTAVGIGAAALIVGTALGVIARNNTMSLHTTAEPGVPVMSRVDAINVEAGGANALFAAGGVLAAAGIGVRLAF